MPESKYISSSSLGGGTGGEIYRLRLHLVVYCTHAKYQMSLYAAVDQITSCAAGSFV